MLLNHMSLHLHAFKCFWLYIYIYTNVYTHTYTVSQIYSKHKYFNNYSPCFIVKIRNVFTLFCLFCFQVFPSSALTLHRCFLLWCFRGYKWSDDLRSKNPCPYHKIAGTEGAQWKIMLIIPKSDCIRTLLCLDFAVMLATQPQHGVPGFCNLVNHSNTFLLYLV